MSSLGDMIKKNMRDKRESENRKSPKASEVMYPKAKKASEVLGSGDWQEIETDEEEVKKRKKEQER